MDQETGSGRRRSSRLAARGITTTPKAETAVKKIAKSSEKPKRAKRKTAEEVIELPEAKKTKTDKPNNEVNNPKEETHNVEKNDSSAVVTPIDVENVETDGCPPSSIKNNALQTVEEKTDENAPLKDSKEEVGEKTSSEVEKDIVAAPAIDDKTKPEVIKEPIKIIEQEKNDVRQGEPEQEPIVLTNSESDDKKTVELVVEAVKNDNGICVTAKDTATPNGNIVEQVKATNGGNKSDAVEPIKVLNDNTNHVVETDLKSATINNAAITTSNNDTSSVEQVEKEVEAKFVDNTIDNASVLAAGDNTPSAVDQTSTFVS